MRLPTGSSFTGGRAEARDLVHRAGAGPLHTVRCWLVAILPQHEWREQPWSGGTTREILRWPEADAFELRVGVHEIVKGGSLPRVPGCSRFLVWIGPHPIDLMFGRRIDTYATPSAASHVLGDPEIVAMVPVGATTLLELVVRDAARYEWGYNAPTQPVRFAFVPSRLEANLWSPPERIAERCLWIA